MATFNMVNAGIIASTGASNEVAAAFDGGKHRVQTDFLVYNSQASGSTLVVGDEIPAGANILAIVVNTDTSTGTATLEFGYTGSLAAYSAPAAYTTVNTPTFTMKPQTATTTVPVQVLATTGTAALPAAGNLRVDIIYSLE